MSRAALLICLLLGLFALGSSTAHAQPAPSTEPASDPRKAEARERFFKGLELAESEEWESALAEFMRSLELFPTRVALKNAGISLQQLRRFSDALAIYQRLLAEFGAELDAEERSKLERSIGELQKKTAELTLESEPVGATIIVDGRQRGTTPSARLRVDAGSRFVRLFKPGYAGYEQELELSGAETRTLKATLKPLTRSGRLRVAEAASQKLEVVIDGASVGTTPWEGLVEVGTRSVVLRASGNLGTPPSTATVFEDRLSVLTLRAVVLDAALRVESSPSSAELFVDGVPVGNGVWEGRLPSGRHTVEAAASGFLSARRELVLAKAASSKLGLELQRDPADPRWRESVFRAHPYVEALVGAFLSPSFQGDADRACARSDCSERSIPLGFLLGARGGYQLAGGLGLELTIGYLRAKESISREQFIDAEQDFGRALAKDYSESIQLSGPLAALSASYRFFEQTPLTVRAWVGAARVRASFTNSGTFSGTATQGTASAPYSIDRLTIPEDDLQLWLPFAGPELRFGWRFSRRLSLDAGAALLVFFGPDHTRTGGRFGRGQTRADFASGARGTFPDGSPVGAPGRVELPREAALGTFLSFVPSVAARLDF